MTSALSPERPSLPRRLWNTIHAHLIQPFLETYDPLTKVSWGASIGVLIGMTPTVGIQMYVVTIIWLFCRYVLRLRFNLTIALSMVWITNPVTLPPLYYLFLQTGDLLLSQLGYEVVEMNYAAFKAAVTSVDPGAQSGWLNWLVAAGQVILVEFGWPMVLGSLVYAVPMSLGAYPFTYFTLRRYRRYLAQQQGLDYAEWRRRCESKE